MGCFFLFVSLFACFVVVCFWFDCSFLLGDWGWKGGGGGGQEREDREREGGG